MDCVIFSHHQPLDGTADHFLNSQMTQTMNSTPRLFTLETFSLVAVTTTVCSSVWILLTALFA